MIVTEKQLLVLELLAQYRYLTATQLQRLGVYKSVPVVRDKALAPLKHKERKLIKAVHFGVHPSIGKLPAIHHLTKKGVRTLQDAVPSIINIKYPKGEVQFTRDYFHRVSFIDLHIALRIWAKNRGNEVIFFDSYFETSQPKIDNKTIWDTQVILNSHTVVPDGNFCLNMTDQEKRLFSLELHRGNNKKVILEQLEQHCEIIEQGLLSGKYQHPFDNYVLSVYEDSKTMDKVKMVFNSSPVFSEYKDYFVFNFLDNLIHNFASNWRYADDSKFALFEV